MGKNQGFKIGNEYADAISARVYARVPKAVFAAIAVSLLVNHQEVFFEHLDAAILEEWRLLNENGIVPQKSK